MNNILYFGFTFEKFDILDFTDDFLAGVRANYFNGGCAPQSNRCTQLLGENEYVFVYRIEDGVPLSWKIVQNGEVCQTAESVDAHTYRVNTYNKSGRVYRRMYFDLSHYWLRSEYFDKNPDYPDYLLYPDEEDGSVIVCEHNCADTKVKSCLYPKYEMPDEGDYCALAFCDSGFVFYNSVPDDRLYSKTIIRDFSSGGADGFSFDAVDFNLSRNLNETFDIRKAEYLTEQNGNPEYVQSNERFNPPVNEFEEKNDDSDLKLYQEDETEPDLVIESASESYRYFGSVGADGKRDGRGRTVTPQGKTAYEGGYKDDRREGFGVFYYKSGSINYVGSWEDNARNGFGIGFRGSDGCAHIGCWADNFPEGIGARFDGGGKFLFLGKYVDGKKQGKGITLDDDGSFVVSVFRDDEVVASYRIDDLLPE